jgi:hypothetical protein
MIKHVGKHGDRKVAIIFREIPGEEHMCLVIYTETLPVAMHDSMMRTIESPMSQTAENLGDALFRELFSDGRPMLQTLHAEGMLKKVQTKQVVVTPNASSHVNLSEMNEILRKMKLGESAVREMAELDSNRGMTGKARRRDEFGREIGAPTDMVRAGSKGVAGSDAALAAAQAPLNSALDDVSIAVNLKSQAERMAKEAQQLIAESQRLLKEAATLDGAATAAKPATKTTRSAKKKVAADAAN